VVLAADSLCIGGVFPVYYGYFPVIYTWSFVHQSGMFRVVDVLCAVSYFMMYGHIYQWHIHTSGVRRVRTPYQENT